MRELQLSKGYLESTFKDIEKLAKECYFSDCKHKSERNCTVKKAIKNKELYKERLRGHEKLQKELIYVQKKKASKKSKINKK